MAKGFSFADKDEELVRLITAYQRDKELPSFIEAVRKLCEQALMVEKLKK